MSQTCKQGEGMKFDGGKLKAAIPFRTTLIALAEIMKVLDFGANKYEEGSYHTVPDGIKRYEDALARHLVSYFSGETFDKESNLHHLAHLCCCAMFIIEMEAMNND